MRVGDKFTNNQGCDLVVTAYNGSKDLEVTFCDIHGHSLKTCSSHVYSGSVKNPYYPSFAGIGYMGVGEFICREAGKITREYQLWSNMFLRCYDKEYTKRNPTYENCTVSEVWHNFQNFAYWCQGQYGFGNKYWHLDKDLLLKGNKLYSPETCCFIPAEINYFIRIHRIASRSLLKGVTFEERTNKYTSQISTKNYKKFLGTFCNEQDAHSAYKAAKECHAKHLLEKYDGQLDARVITRLEQIKLEDI